MTLNFPAITCQLHEVYMLCVPRRRSYRIHFFSFFFFNYLLFVVYYRIRLKVVISGNRIDRFFSARGWLRLVVPLPVVIGTVPLKGNS